MIEEAMLGGVELQDDSLDMVEEEGGVNGEGVEAAEEVIDGASDFCDAVGDRRQEIGS